MINQVEEVRWRGTGSVIVTHAAEQRNQLPSSMHTAFDAKGEELKRDPYAVGSYDECEGSYTTTFGDTGREPGIIVHTASGKIDMVTIARILCRMVTPSVPEC